MQFRQQIAANKHAITGIKSRHYIAVMLNSAKHAPSAAPGRGIRLPVPLTWFSTRCDIAWTPLQGNSQLRMVDG
jgi:hypothetical protein